MTMGDGVGRAGFHAVTAKDAARVINVVNARVAFPGRNALGIGIFRGLNINAICRARRGTEKATDAFLQPIFIALQNVYAAISRLKMHGLERIILRGGRAKHVPERNAKTFHQSKKGLPGLLENRWHRVSV